LSGCPVCDQPLPAQAPLCTSCGYPTALALDALRALSDGDPTPVNAAVTRPSEPPKRRRPKVAAPDPEEEILQKIATDTDHDLAMLQELGGETLDVASDLRQAALAQADGRVVEALDIVRRAAGRALDQGRRLFEERVHEIEVREASLQSSGVGTGVMGDCGKMRSLYESGQRLEAIALLRATDQLVGRVEGDWKGLQGLLRQIEGLRQSLKEAGEPLDEVEADIRKVREMLAGAGPTVERLDTATQVAARAVMLLHEALPKALQEELARHDATLEKLPAQHEPARKARELHADAVRHLRRGRLNEATQSLRDLRGALTLLKESVPATPPVPAATARAEAAASTPDTTEFLNRLLAKARGLAARVRTLPPESDIAFEAAAEIRRATELLRARKLEEAESALTRLMQTLEAGTAAEEA
jgi:hypothetical protein